MTKRLIKKIQCFPYPNQHAFRIKNPSLFEKGSMRTKSLKKGVSIIIGKLKGQSTMTAQAYRFDKSIYSYDDAKKWIKDNNINPISSEKASMQAFVRLYSEIQALSQEDILSKIPPDILNGIKSIDPHPFFQMYSIAHEGTSNPKILGEKSKPIYWSKKAIQSIASVIKEGIKFFQGHNETNDKITQKELGKVVHTFQEEIDGKLHQIAIGYFPNKNDAINNDVCSQEATWSLIEDAGKLIADKCKEITGIALENSENAKPAFAGAKRLGYVQAFEEPGKGNNGGEPKPGNGEKNMTFQEVQKAVNELNIFPSQLYDLEKLKKDRVFGPEFDKIGNLEKLKADLETSNKKLLDDLGVLKRENNVSTAKSRILNITKEKNIPDKIKSFIEKSFDEDYKNIDDLSDASLNKYIDNELKTYQRVASAIGIENDDINLNNDKNKDKSDLTDPENNEFLEE